MPCRPPSDEKPTIRKFLLLTAAWVLAGCAAFSGGAPVKTTDGVFVTEAGMTLYTFDKDVAGSGKSVCNGPCATTWPPLAAAAAKASGDWSIVTRDDGSRQWAHKGKPLYGWIKDQKPGDRAGDGFNNAWRLTRP